MIDGIVKGDGGALQSALKRQHIFIEGNVGDAFLALVRPFIVEVVRSDGGQGRSHNHAAEDREQDAFPAGSLPAACAAIASAFTLCHRQ